MISISNRKLKIYTFSKQANEMEQISPKKDKNECISGPPTKKPRLEEVETGTKNSHSLPGPEIAMDSTFS